MTKARIYKLAWYYTLERIEEEVEKVVEAERAGKRHTIADARLARYYAEEAELHELLLKAENEKK